MATLEAYVVTFNCARNLVNPKTFAPHLLQAASKTPDIIVFCLQEVAPIGYAFLGGSFLTPYYNAFASAVQLATTGYVNVISRNVGLTAIIVFATEDVANNISWLETAGTGVGFQQTGHKGAVGVRLGYDDSVLTFVSAHLAPHEQSLQRRNQDFRDIAERLVFVKETKQPKSDERDEDAPLLQGSTSNAGPGAKGLLDLPSHLVFGGDLNYRTSSQPPTEEDVKMFPKPRKDREDPLHWSHLLQHDQLSTEVKEGRTLNGMEEMPIEFPPTYKYKNKVDVLEDGDEEWQWASHRWPSWCDRIFFSPTNMKPHAYEALPLFGTSDHRPVALSISIPLKVVDDREGQQVSYKLDPEWKSKREAARRKELVVGAVTYLTWTREGEGLLLATIVAVCGIGFVLHSVLM
jgi:endonuclease/exonuclease/phosphatase family metal-dependent hydrolase